MMTKQLQIISEYKNSVSKHKNSVSKYKNSISKYKNSVPKCKKCLPQFAKHTDAFHETPRRPHIATKTSQIGCERWIERVVISCVKGRTSRRPKMARHGRRPKSVGDPSRRVWEATTTVFWGMTRGSRTHRSRYENGGEWGGLFVWPSVISGMMRTIMSSRKQMVRGLSVENRAFLMISDAIWILSATQDEIGRWVIQTFDRSFYRSLSIRKHKKNKCLWHNICDAILLFRFRFSPT